MTTIRTTEPVGREEGLLLSPTYYLPYLHLKRDLARSTADVCHIESVKFSHLT